MGMQQHKILDQYLTSGIVPTRSIQRFKRFTILKNLTTVRDHDLKVSEGVWNGGRQKMEYNCRAEIN